MVSTGYQGQGSVIKSIKENGGGFNANAYISALWVHCNHQDPICANSKDGFVKDFYKLSSIFGIKSTDIYCSLNPTL